MALVARQYKLMDAVRTTLRAESDLSASLNNADSWRLHKLSFHRGATWKAGSYISPLVGLEAPYENKTDRIDVRILAIIVDGVNEGDPAIGLETGLARIERVEDIFRKKAGSEMPYLFQVDGTGFSRASAGLSGSDNFVVQLLDIEPADRFIAGAAQLGYDASATIIKASITVSRRNVSALGGP